MPRDPTVTQAAEALNRAVDLCLILEFDRVTFLSVAGKVFDNAVAEKVRADTAAGERSVHDQ